MPSADDFVPAFDDIQEQIPVSHLQPSNEPVEVPSKSKKKKKRDKKDTTARQSRLDDGNESSAYPKSITPSPPKEDVIESHQPIFPPQAVVQPNISQPSLLDLGEDSTAVEDVDIVPSPRQSLLFASPPVQSPKPVSAKPVTIATPPSRPVSLHGHSQRDRKNSSTAYHAPPPPPPPPQQTQQRRDSFASFRPPRFVDPPPPHMPQAHFFTLPDLGLKLNHKQDSGRPAGSDGYCCRIDSLADAGDDVSARKARDALLVGSEGGLDVFRILANKLEVVGRLEGLKGSVIGAKILPHIDRVDDLQIFRPLVAVVIHGPISSSQSRSAASQEDRHRVETSPASYQTTVDVYSLQTQHYIATLYSSVPCPVEAPAFSQLPSVPDPVGDLQIDASGQFITISSGKSGEVFVFTQAAQSDSEETRFRCVGKFWTAVQKVIPAPQPSGSSEGTATVEAKGEPRIPLMSLSPRWLAIVPPMLSQDISIQGFPLLSDINPSPPGITTHAAPPQPQVTCEVAGTDIEGTWSRLGRQAAQGLVKYSQKGIEMGLQGWKELTQPSPPNARLAHDRSSSKDELFPPTKATSEDPNRLKREPALVSIIDLDSLIAWEVQKPKYSQAPMATFALIDGCNFLSLSSTGTRLLTSSRKGEIAFIWDLKQLAHGVPRCDSDNSAYVSSGPCIKQLQRIARNSPSIVLGCAWSRDDECIAILTAHGTIHLHEVPRQPPYRRRNKASSEGTLAAAAEKADATVSLSAGMSPPSANHGFLGSIKSSWQSVSTQVNSIRSTNPASAFGLPTTFAGFREVTAAAGTASSRAVARGISQGYTAAKDGASDYWHADDNKIRHTKALQEPLSAKSLKWIRRNDTVSVAVACGGNVHVHPVQHVTRRKGDAIISGLKHERYAHKAFPLPLIATRAEAGIVKPDACTDQGPHGFWSFGHSTTPGGAEGKAGIPPNSSLHTQVNDVETNPPYCPFHVDARVHIHAFDEDNSNSQIGPMRRYERFLMYGHGLPHESPWAFGEPLPASIKINDRVPDDPYDSSFEDGETQEDDEDVDLASQMESKLTIQPARRKDDGNEIRINTRRRPGKGLNGDLHSGAAGEFDLLEDDDGMD